MNIFIPAHPCLLRHVGFLLLLMLPAAAWSQELTVKGTVTDQASGNPLTGVSIGLKGTSQGAVSDVAGRYSLKVPSASGTLVFSYIGYVRREEPLNGRTTVNVVLAGNSADINEVVVVGYGTQKRKDVTGAIVSLDKKRLDNLPNTNFAQALQGAAAGVSVSQNAGGAEGNDNAIVIRGRNSITASNSPLIVLDGIPYNGGISDINPSDIASIDVLKDASSAAIYGSRGANGVILVTTKKGSSGKPVITYDGFYGIQEIANLPPTLNAAEFHAFKMHREPTAMTNSEQAIYDAGTGPDWVKLATRRGARTQHTLSVRGGTNAVRYYVSGTYLNVKGVAVNDNFKRGSLRANIDVNITGWLSMGTGTQLSMNDRSGLPATFSGDFGAYTLNPLTTALDGNGRPIIYPWPEDVYFANPLAPTLARNDDKTYKVFSNNYIQVRFPFVKGLSYRLNTGVEHTSRRINTYYGRDTKQGLEAQGRMSNSDNIDNNYTIENILTFDREFGKHNLNFTGLYSYQYANAEEHSLDAEGFPNDVLTWYQANVAKQITPSASYTKEVLISQMARINYSYNSKYMLTLTGRRDGYSGFGVSKKYSFFPSVAVGWNISSEPFLAGSKTLTSLKLRASYGSNGNQAVGPYQTLANLTERSYINGITTAPGYVPTNLANPNLGWETTNSFNIGVDFSLWNSRLQGSVEAYNAKTHDLLLERKISTVHGINTITQNIGRTSNQGLEIELNSINIQRKFFTWSTSANLSFNRNRIEELYGDGKDDILNKWFLGKPITVNYDLVYDGVWQQNDDLSHAPQPDVKPGYAKVKDINGDGAINDNDRTIIGNRVPTFIWGMGNTLRYGNFSLYIFVQGVQGVKRSNNLLSDNGVNAGVRKSTIRKNWWTPDNPTNDFWANDLKANVYGVSIYQDASFIRMKDISLSYDLSPALLSRLKLNKLRVYVNARNLFTITKWTGLDPELDGQMAIPLQREYLVGINIGL